MQRAEMLCASITTMEDVPLPLANSDEQVCIYPPCENAGRRMEAPAALRLWHLTSLDAPTVAVVWALAFARAGGIRLPLWVSALQALGAWTVYVGDRLLDARSGLRRGAGHTLRERHFFHWRNRYVLAPLAACAAAAAATMIVFLMPIAIGERNALLGAAALVYFSGVHAPGRRKWQPLPKELLVGVLFTAGCALPTLTRLRMLGAGWTELASLLGAAAVFAALAWLNCYAIERWESGTSAGTIAPWKAAAVLAIVSLCLGVLLAWKGDVRIAVLMATASAGAMLLALLDKERARLTPVALRAAADLALLTPLVWLLR
ncbi:MAG: hypothetical protein KGJ51_09400 [Acidobacteriota bacterium]|nr:hypothetical protein [Acidobacteriota bacterium]